LLIGRVRPTADRHQSKKVNVQREEEFSSSRIDVMSPDAKIRNTAAITLMDSGNLDAVEALVAAIEVVAYREARGTLIYALRLRLLFALFTDISLGNRRRIRSLT
jgi:hypothetical protein